MGGPQITKDAWRASKEYAAWADVPNKIQHAEYNATYQKWRNDYANYTNLALTRGPFDRRKLGRHSVSCGCGGQYQAHNRHFIRRHENSKKHLKWVEEQKNKKPKKPNYPPPPPPKRVVCEFLW
tara:strand:+ start:320 stop:691 length:372 start_codon:yes stop_codon:yes gene_type:complete